MLGFYTMDNFVRWIAIEPNIEHLRVYALNGDWSDGTFVVVVSVCALCMCSFSSIHIFIQSDISHSGSRVHENYLLMPLVG